MFLRQNFHLFFDGDVIRSLMEGILDYPRLAERYPFLEFRLVPERLPERIYRHLIAYPTNCCHDELEPVEEIAERSVLLLG